MADTRLVNGALGSFHDWEHPWTYIHTVLSSQGLKDSEIQVMNELWAEATDAKHWVVPSFEMSEQLIRQKLETTYPWLSTHASDALIRGASYVWK